MFVVSASFGVYILRENLEFAADEPSDRTTYAANLNPPPYRRAARSHSFYDRGLYSCIAITGRSSTAPTITTGIATMPLITFDKALPSQRSGKTSM